jgi:hypothetical protein
VPRYDSSSYLAATASANVTPGSNSTVWADGGRGYVAVATSRNATPGSDPTRWAVASGDAVSVRGKAIDSGVASATAGQTVGAVAPDGNSIKAQTKQVIDIRDWRAASGDTVDCTGTKDSSAAMNALTSTQDTVTSKTISTRGCAKIRLDNQWLIHGQESLEIDLGGTIAANGVSQGGHDDFRLQRVRGSPG